MSSADAGITLLAAIAPTTPKVAVTFPKVRMIVPPLVLKITWNRRGRLHEWNLNSVFRTKGNKFCFENFPRDYAELFSVYTNIMIRRFPPPWSAELTQNCFIVRDADGQKSGSSSEALFWRVC
jgi:hypothetical protein